MKRLIEFLRNHPHLKLTLSFDESRQALVIEEPNGGYINANVDQMEGFTDDVVVSSFIMPMVETMARANADPSALA